MMEFKEYVGNHEKNGWREKLRLYHEDGEKRGVGGQTIKMYVRSQEFQYQEVWRVKSKRT